MTKNISDPQAIVSGINTVWNSVDTTRILIIILVGLFAYLVYLRLTRYWLGTALKQLVSRSNTSKRRERQMVGWLMLLEKVGGIFILAVIVLSVLSELNFNITPILTGAGIVGLAIGLGSQNVMKDVISGIFILLEGNFKEGDKVKIAGVSGVVRKITLRRTVLISEKKGAIHVVPNSEIKTVSLMHTEKGRGIGNEE